MKKTLSAVAIAAALSTSFNAQAFDLGGLFGAEEETSSTAQNETNTASGSQTNMLSQGLLDLVGSQLDVTPAQAAGGVGALMGYASNALPNEYSQQLNALLPGLESSGGSSLTSSLLGSVKDMDSVKTAFSALGMDSSMVDQFIPLIEGYLGDNGGSDLVGALGNIWS